MQEPESNPSLKGDPQTKTASFCASPQIPHLFKMKTKIKIMTSIQCGETALFFFPHRMLFLLKPSAFLYKGLSVSVVSLCANFTGENARIMFILLMY